MRWAAHDVRLHRTGRQEIRHPVVGDVRLDFEVLELPAAPGLSVVTSTAPAGPQQSQVEQLPEVRAGGGALRARAPGWRRSCRPG